MAAKKNSKKSTVSKSEYIRTQSAMATAAEVVAKAAGLGMKFDEAYVHKIRGRAKKSAAPSAPAAKAAVAKPAASKVVLSKPAAAAAPVKSKADFVRSLANFSSKEVVARAKAAGIKIAESYVYNVRGYDKLAAKKSGAKPPVRPQAVRNAAAPKLAAPKVVAPVASQANGSQASTENLLRAVAAEIGLGRALEILKGERARVRAVFGQ